MISWFLASHDDVLLSYRQTQVFDKEQQEYGEIKTFLLVALNISYYYSV